MILVLVNDWLEVIVEEVSHMLQECVWLLFMRNMSTPHHAQGILISISSIVIIEVHCIIIIIIIQLFHDIYTITERNLKL